MFYGTKVQNIMKSKQIMLIFFFFALVNIILSFVGVVNLNKPSILRPV